MCFCVAVLEEEEKNLLLFVCVSKQIMISRIKPFENNPTPDFPRLIGREFQT